MSARRERIKDYATGASLRAAGRAGGYLREGPGGVNLEKIIFYGLLAAGAYVAYKAWKAAGAIGSGVNAATKAAADAYVNVTHPGVKLADGITYTLPNGTKIPASKTTAAGGGKFYYSGGIYLPVAASPPGSGNYTVKKV